MIRSQSMGFLWAALLATGLHAVLFVLLKPNMRDGLAGIPVTPNTSYLSSPPGLSPMTGTEVRTISSPVLFSLPSKMGFSRELSEQDVQTQLKFSQELNPEQFLEAGMERVDGGLDVNKLMLTSILAEGPSIPDEVYAGKQDQPFARRVSFAPELKSRLVNGVVLPTELNQEASKAWEVRADVSVSSAGTVDHVFLEKPLESAPLNQGILRLLYSLQFKSGEPVNGRVEIYSPETRELGGDGK